MPSRFRYSLLGAHFTRSCDVIHYVTNRFAIGQFLVVVHWNRSFISCRFKIFASKYNWVTILTFWGHLMLSVMWDNGSQTLWVTTLTFVGHVRSSVMWPLDSPNPISYSCSIVTKPLSPALIEILGPKDNWVTPWHFKVMWRHRSRDQSIPHRPFPIRCLLVPRLYL